LTPGNSGWSSRFCCLLNSHVGSQARCPETGNVDIVTDRVRGERSLVHVTGIPLRASDGGPARSMPLESQQAASRCYFTSYKLYSPSVVTACMVPASTHRVSRSTLPLSADLAGLEGPTQAPKCRPNLQPTLALCSCTLKSDAVLTLAHMPPSTTMHVGTGQWKQPPPPDIVAAGVILAGQPAAGNTRCIYRESWLVEGCRKVTKIPRTCPTWLH
jgi:hypothetical protein